MPVRKRNLTRRAALSQTARDWLDGDPNCSVFFRGKPIDELAELWEQYGDKEAMHWDRSMRFQLPVPINN